MQYSIEDVIGDRRRRAEEILNYSIEIGMPPERLLVKQYGSELAREVREGFEELRNEVNGLKPRDPPNPLESELASKKRMLELSPDFRGYRGIMKAIGPVKAEKIVIPDPIEFVQLHGEFANEVARHYRIYKRMRLVRDCDLIYPVHCHRCAGAATVHGYDKLPSEKPKFYYPTLWAMHDDEEEILPGFKRADGKVDFGLEGLARFRDQYFSDSIFPPGFAEDISYLTNYGRTIRKYIQKGLDITVNNIDDLIMATSVLSNSKYDEAREEIEAFRHFVKELKEKDPDMQRDEYFHENFNQVQYREDFLEDLRKKAVSDNNLRLFEGKGVIDIYDGLIATHAKDLMGRREGVRKMMDWARIAKNLTGKWTPFDEKIPQCIAMANYVAREIGILYLAQSQAQQNYIISGIRSLIFMKDALYETF